MKIVIFLKIILSISLLLFFTGCVERYISKGSVDNNTDWKTRPGGGRSGTSKDATELRNFEKESIKIIVEPCNYLESMQKKDDFFVITGWIATYYKDEKELSFMPKNSFLNIDELIIYPTNVATPSTGISTNNCIESQWKNPDTVIVKGKGKFDKYNNIHHVEVGFSLLFRIKPPSVEKEFKLDLGSIYIDEKEIKVPTMKFEKGIHYVGFLM